MMIVTETGFNGLYLVKPHIFEDRRGYFFESYNSRAYREAGLDFNPVQDNESSSVRGVIRGLHYQLNPAAQSKLIRVIEGTIFDVAVDLRSDSPTFGKWFGTELDSSGKLQLFIPKGFAHGFSVLSEKATILYKCDHLYSPDHEQSVRFDDPELSIDWRIEKGAEIVSDKDLAAPLFNNAIMNF